MHIEELSPDASYTVAILGDNVKPMPPSEPEDEPYIATEEEIRQFNEDIEVATHILVANSKKPVVIDERIQKIIIKRMEDQFIELTGMNYAQAKEYFDQLSA